MTALVIAALAALIYDHLPDITTARLPGAAGGSSTFAVTAHFSDVLDLVPNATVRLSDVPVGRVTSIKVGDGGPAGHVAVVELAIDRRFQLPADTTAAIRNSSLMGEKYVALTAPDGGAGSLAQIGQIPLARTTDDVEVEQLLSSFGALLNGGGLQQISVLTREFAAALGGHEQSVRGLLGDLNSIVNQLNAGKPQLLAAIDSAQRFSAVLAARSGVIGRAIDDLDPATGVLADQERLLTSALSSLRRLDRTATPLLRASTADTAADLRALGPVTRELGKVAGKVPQVLTTLVTYPFADNSINAFSNAYAGDSGSLDLDLATLLASTLPNVGSATNGSTGVAGAAGTAGGANGIAALLLHLLGVS